MKSKPNDMTSTNPNKRALRERRANTMRSMHGMASLLSDYGFARTIRLSVASQLIMNAQKPAELQKNTSMVARVTYYAKKYDAEITRLCHIKPQWKSERDAKHLKVWDLERGELRTPILKYIKRVELLTFGELSELVKKDDYLYDLVFQPSND